MSNKIVPELQKKTRRKSGLQGGLALKETRTEKTAAPKETGGQEQPAAAETDAAAKSKAEKLAENTVKYAAIVKEAYADYRRTRSRFPQLAEDLATGTAEALYHDSDRVFRMEMEEEAKRLGLNLKKLKKQIENLRTGSGEYPGSPDRDPYEQLRQLFG